MTIPSSAELAVRLGHELEPGAAEMNQLLQQKYKKKPAVMSKAIL